MSRTGIQQTLINHVYKRNLRSVNTRYRWFIVYVVKKNKIKVYWYYRQAIYKIKYFLNRNKIIDHFTYFNKETLKSGYVSTYHDGRRWVSIHEDILTEELFAQYDNDAEILNIEDSLKPLTDIMTEETNIYVKVQKALEFFRKIKINNNL